MENYDTSVYDTLPISAFIYEPVRDENNGEYDFRIVYANRIFLDDWKRIYENDDCIGSFLKRNTLMDEDSLGKLTEFVNEKPYAFSSYLPMVNLYLCFHPLEGLPAPYTGFLITNITDREEQEARVHFLQSIRQMNGNSVLMKKHAGGYFESVFVSDEYAKMMECTVEEALDMMDGLGFLRSTSPEDRPFVRSMLNRRVGDDGTSNLTIQKITAKKNRIWCNVHYAFIDDFSEHYVYCTYTNVTVLKTYEDRLRSVYMNIGANFYKSVENALAMLRVNLTKDSIEEVKGQDLYDCDSIHYRYVDFLEKRTEVFPLTQERESFRKTFEPDALCSGYHEGRVNASQVLYSRRKSGRLCFVEFSAELTRHPMTGDIIAFITERECNSEKLREILMTKILAKQFDMVAYLAEGKYGVTIGDASRIRKGSIFPSERSGDYARYLDDQVLPVLDGDDDYKKGIMKALSLETVEKMAWKNDPYFVDIAIKTGGETFRKRFDFYAVAPDIKFYIVLKSDTTELQREQQRRNDQLRLALEEAERANVAKTAFLSSMSHEIRTPMNAIIGIDNIALSDPNLLPETKEQLEKIGMSARHLLGLINDILDMSRIESGMMMIKSEEFEFGGFLEQINTLVSSQCQDKGLTYECRINGSVADYYIGDDMKLKQVLINILGNAVKFTPSPGSVTLDVEQTGSFEENAALKFTISDTGIGMDKEYLPKIFDAFSQEDATTTNSYGGSGLGMAITKNIVEMMSGNISVESEKGKGTVFTVNVTLRTSDRKAENGDGDIRPQDMSVLIIDDDATALEHAKLVLEEVGMHADTALSGSEALDMMQLRNARREPYNLILVDMRMPGQNGIEVTKKIRELYKGQSAVVMLTAYSWEDIEADAREAGVDGFIGKPLLGSGLLSSLKQALGRRSVKSEQKKERDLSGKRVLIAEDIMINAEIIKRLLQMKGMVTEHAENGKKAVDMFAASEENYYDAVLMDMRMPVMDGLTATKSIRALGRQDSAAVPIIALTANAFDEDVQHSLQAGMNAHLSKPIEPDKLFETLSGLIK